MGRLKVFLLLSIISGFLFRHTLSSNILFIQTCASFSHRTAEWPLVEGLAANGHKVTFMSPFKDKFPSENPNITDITPVSLNDYMTEMLRSTFDVSHRAKGIVPPMWLVIDWYCYITCDVLLQSKELQEWISTTPKVDLVLADVHPECAYGLSQKLKSKSVLIQPIPVISAYSDIFGIPHEASSIPDIDVTLKTPIPLWKRIIGNILPLWFKLIKSLTYSFLFQPTFKRHLGLDKQASYDDMNANLSLIMTNSDYLEDYSRSYPPFIVKVPALHVKPKSELTPLDSAMEYFINSVSSNKTKPEGFIYISLGTVVNAGSMPHQIRDVFFDTIMKFPNIRFVWRWTGDLPPEDLVPQNLLLRSWFDQQSILAHPKIKGFLFQAGRPSMEEAIRFGVPTISFPVVCDQDFNSYRLDMLGSSIALELTDLHIKPELLYDSINDILTDSKYLTNSKRLMNLANDVPVPSVEKAVWWIEFVLRHTQEDLNLLKSPSQQLTWYQRRDLDAWAIIALITFIAVRISYHITRKVFRKLFMSRAGSVASKSSDEHAKQDNHLPKPKLRKAE